MTRTARTPMVFASPLAGDAAPASANTPKKVCENWARDGDCPYGDRCLFAHPPQNESPKRTVCPPAKVARARTVPAKQVFVSPLGFNNEFHKVLPKIDIAQKAKDAFEKCNNSLAHPLSESLNSNNACSNGSMSSDQSSCSPSESISASSNRRPIRPARALPKARNVRRISVASDSVECESVPAAASPTQPLHRVSCFGIVPSSRTPNGKERC